MAFTTPTNVATGDVLTATRYNNEVVDNAVALYGSQKRFAQEKLTSPYNFTATTVAASSDVFSPDLSWTADGSAYKIEFFCPRVILGGTAYVDIHLVNGAGTSLAVIATILTNGFQGPAHLAFYYTPSAGAATVNIRGVTPVGGGTCTLTGGAGGAGVIAPMFMNVYGPDIT